MRVADNGASAAGLSWRLLAVHFGEESGDGVGADRHADGGEQFADHSQRRTLLPKLDDTVLERHQLCVTRRRRWREVADSGIETLRLRCDVGGVAHVCDSESAPNSDFLGCAKG